MINILDNDLFLLKRLKKIILIMKTSVLLSLVLSINLLAVDVNGQHGSFHVKMENETIRNVLKIVESQSDYRFFFTNDFTDINKRVSIDINTNDVSYLLSQIFNKSTITFKVLENNIVALTPVEVLQQGVVITGTVKDNEGNTMPGVNVTVKGTMIGSVTDINGLFKINVPNEEAVLIFSFIGFATVEIPVGNLTTINVTMSEVASQLEEVVVVAYGTQKVREITGSMTKLSSGELSDMPVSNMAQKLQGKLSGVQIFQTNGEPNGGGVSIRIRGQASLSAGNSPLLVIDGFPSGTTLADLSPDEIENITVLKDAASATLYGSRAANGVILVTTKAAKAGKTNIDFSVKYGVAKVGERGRPDMMNAREYAQFKKEFYEDQMRYEGRTDPVPEMYANPESVKDGTDWYDLLLRNSLTQDYNLSLTTGVGRLRSSANLNYFKEEGTVLNTFADRISARLNNVYEANDRVTFGTNISGSYRWSNITASLGEGRNVIHQAYLMDPQLKYKYGVDEKPWETDAARFGMSNNPDHYIYTEDGIYPFGWTAPGMFAMPNWYNALMYRKNPRRNTNLSTTAYMDVTIIDGLKYRLSVNGNLRNSEYQQWIPSYATGSMGSRPPGSASGRYDTGNSLNWMIENTLNYTKQFNAHDINILAGYSTQKDQSRTSRINSSNFPDNEVDWWGAATTRTATAGESNEYSIISYFSRINYAYNSKYLLQLSFRSDGCSRFGANKKYAAFPSVSLGWIASEELFMQEINQLSFLKIRGSWGKVGNNNIGNYAYISSDRKSVV